MSCGFDHGWWADRFYEYVEGQRTIIAHLEDISIKLGKLTEKPKGTSKEWLLEELDRIEKKIKGEGDG